MSQTVLEINELTKQLNRKNIVHNASFQMKKGEILGLLGPNGAGKTTTIRMIVGLIKKTSGKVYINGRDLDEEGRACKSEIGAIVENPAFYDHMSGYKNLEQYARMAKNTISKKRVNEVVELVKLTGAIHDKVKKYSLGMKQRLGVAQAILHEPALLILDEPTNGLDPKGIRDLRDYLRQLADNGISTLVSSHLLSEMQLMCDRVVIMEKGKIINISNIHEEEETESVAGQLVALRVADNHIGLAQEVIAGVKEVTLSQRENGSVLLLKMPYDFLPELNRRLVQGGVDVFGLESRRSTLEDKFLALTSEKSDELQKEAT
ncbi:ATP-binding cassette domain-containing protein [Salipaludibacillus sp. CUR1]|uniref:ABC transporter ATP-binding protein n=1 Tax=Salipaludibacillus sp. CUR1 TaxID=2820003 RepID=UPI001E3E6109|nr:ATP-binding cassette domain-containing protein [Salipaludibacillus sp. CUR1]MCE7792537.1 ATP-binding cassette domain-containing protein [Salipaludibacillus sp. CUR1]